MEYVFRPESHLDKAIYNAEAKTVDVTFKRGGPAYRYFDFPPEALDEFTKAPSPGAHLSKVIA